MKYIEKYDRYVDCDCNVYRWSKSLDKLVQVKLSITNGGYVSVSCKARKVADNISRSVGIHRLIYEAFKGEIPEGMEIDHIDCNKMNNNPDNLRIVTRSENMNNPLTKEKIKGNPWSEFGKKFKEHFGDSVSDNIKHNLYAKEYGWYNRHNKCRWE